MSQHLNIVTQLYPNWVGELHTFKLENVAYAIQLLCRSLVSPLFIHMS